MIVFSNPDNIDVRIYGSAILEYFGMLYFFSGKVNEITTDNNMKIEGHNIYFIGDGAGKAGNIVTAAATGLVASRDILKTIK